jgi:hypothetical protein
VKLFDAIKQSPVDTAVRQPCDGARQGCAEPNLAIKDGSRFKAFRVVHNYGWERRPLRVAAALTDWRPSEVRHLVPASG